MIAESHENINTKFADWCLQPARQWFAYLKQLVP